MDATPIDAHAIFRRRGAQRPDDRGDDRRPRSLLCVSLALIALAVAAPASANEEPLRDRATQAVSIAVSEWQEYSSLPMPALDEDEAEDSAECAADAERLIARAQGCVDAGRFVRAMEHAAQARSAIRCARAR